MHPKQHHIPNVRGYCIVSKRYENRPQLDKLCGPCERYQECALGHGVLAMIAYERESARPAVNPRAIPCDEISPRLECGIEVVPVDPPLEVVEPARPKLVLHDGHLWHKFYIEYFAVAEAQDAGDGVGVEALPFRAPTITELESLLKVLTPDSAEYAVATMQLEHFKQDGAL